MFGKNKKIRAVTEALYVSNNILRRALKEDIEVTPMKLQKILYFVYRNYLQETGTPLFDERFQVWQYGPVLESVYREYKRYSKDAITRCYSNNDKTYYVDEDTSPKLKAVIDAVWEQAKHHDGIYLSKKTQESGSAWYDAFKKDRQILFDDEILNDNIVIN